MQEDRIRLSLCTNCVFCISPITHQAGCRILNTVCLENNSCSRRKVSMKLSSIKTMLQINDLQNTILQSSWRPDNSGSSAI